MRHPRITIAAVAVVAAGAVGGIALAAGGGGSGSGSLYGSGSSKPSQSHTSNAPRVAVVNLATVQTATVDVQGTAERILVDSKGLPLYTYKGDTPTKSAVSAQLAAAWPPLMSNHPTLRGAKGTLTTASTSNGRQVAYNGHFLYTFVSDSPGHVTGQGVENFTVATPTLTTTMARKTMPVAPSQSANGQGW
jgi:predicted lipoprotein with Yx(FWY)xxD motif